MIVPEGSRYSDWKYVEVANWVPDLGRVIRWGRKTPEDQPRDPVFLEWGDEVERFRKKHDNVGIYTSVCRFNDKNVDSPRVSSLYFDFDSEDDVQDALDDARHLHNHIVDYVPEKDIRLYFTGSKGFHIEAEAVTLGIDPGFELHDIFRYIGETLKEELDIHTLDMAVYDDRRMWRLPNSKHQKTGLYKQLLPKAALTSTPQKVKEYCKELRPKEVPDPSFSVRANEWYRSWITRYEKSIEEQEAEYERRRLELFQKYGTSLLNRANSNFIKAVWNDALSKLRSPDLKGERNNTLSRQAYRLYLTYLSADKPLQEVEDVLYDVGVSIGLGKREVKATLRSAERAAKHKYKEDPSGGYYDG